MLHPYSTRALITWTHFEAVSLLHEKPLSLCGEVHFLSVLGDQRVEVSIVLLSYSIWREGWREGEVILLSSAHNIHVYLSLLSIFVQASEPLVFEILHGLRFGLAHWHLEGQMNYPPPTGCKVHECIAVHQ